MLGDGDTVAVQDPPRYFLDSPGTVLLCIAVWWASWIVVANLRSRFIEPRQTSILVVLFVTSLLAAGWALQRRLPATEERVPIVTLEIDYPFLKLQLLAVASFFFLVCVPKIIAHPLGYRLSTYFDHALGIESSIFPSPMWQAAFELLYCYAPLYLLVIGAANGDKKLFRKSATLLFFYALVVLSRGVFLTIAMVFLAMPQRRRRGLAVAVLIAAMVVVVPDYVDYDTLGCSLLERRITEHELFDPTTSRSDRFHSLQAIAGWVLSAIRSVDQEFFTGFEAIGRSSSEMVDIGRDDGAYYNAFYTNLNAPVYDLGWLGPIALGVATAAAFFFVSRARTDFVRRSLTGYGLYMSIFGNQQSLITDRNLVLFVLLVMVIDRMRSGQAPIPGEGMVA